MDFFQRAAEQQHAAAQCNLGVLYAQALGGGGNRSWPTPGQIWLPTEGLGVEKDEQMAKSFYVRGPRSSGSVHKMGRR